jgi:hypothetical protein
MTDAEARFELQGDPKIQIIGPIGHAYVAVSLTGRATCARLAPNKPMDSTRETLTAVAG